MTGSQGPLSFTLIGPSDPRWARTLAHTAYDIYQRPEWCETHASLDGGNPLAIHATDGSGQFIFPLVRRAIEADLWDAVSPYGYPGYALSSASGPTFASSVLEQMPEFLRNTGCVTAFGRLNPLDEPPPASDLFHPTGKTVAVSLRRTEGEYRASLRKGHRYDIRRAQREGVVVTTSALGDHTAEFQAIYSETMERLHAGDYYRLPVSYFDRLDEVFGSDITLARAKLGDQTIGVSLFLTSRTAGRIHYHLSATRTDYLHLQPSKAILDHIIVTHLSGAYSHLHLGGGRGGAQDHLFHFKQGFGDTVLTFHTLRMIADPEKYRGLSSASATDGYFPAYRRPDMKR